MWAGSHQARLEHGELRAVCRFLKLQTRSLGYAALTSTVGCSRVASQSRGESNRESSVALVRRRQKRRVHGRARRFVAARRCRIGTNQTARRRGHDSETQICRAGTPRQWERPEMKSALRYSKASGTEKAKIERLIRRGWKPGFRIGDFLGGKRRKGVGRHE